MEAVVRSALTAGDFRVENPMTDTFSKRDRLLILAGRGVLGAAAGTFLAYLVLMWRECDRTLWYVYTPADRTFVRVFLVTGAVVGMVTGIREGMWETRRRRTKAPET